MKLLSTLLTAILVAIPAVSAAHTCHCGDTSYDNNEIVGAINEGYSKNNSPTKFSGGYPHKFGNTENLSFEDCMEGTLVEYPLKTKTPWKGGSRPGADRVVYLLGEDKTFCGCMTHTGAKHNKFVECEKSS
ncbi:hypothetical protein K443DRAFT_134889 [Laccaria amethystina LaAM-08-1]|uniref:Uncharacterized protein n=1 Tax=Laccaria amethystina LaAM-08-1 TaxID=1095629 RepID=A0A0C9WYL3_9AGAR|nr:hypothetical protein K443DRAFT_134889 [Laccaria amethystina LaAM-08-1]